MHMARIRTVGTPDDLKRALGPQATLEDVFRHHAEADLEDEGRFRDVRQTRRTAGRLG